MAKIDPIGIRFTQEEREALERAAAADDRPISALARKVLVEWLIANKWLRKPKA